MRSLWFAADATLCAGVLVHLLSQVLLDFDLDCCAMAFDGASLLALPRALAALDTRFCRLRPYLRETTNTRRPLKYVNRGFGLALPDW